MGNIVPAVKLIPVSGLVVFMLLGAPALAQPDPDIGSFIITSFGAGDFVVTEDGPLDLAAVTDASDIPEGYRSWVRGWSDGTSALLIAAISSESEYAARVLVSAILRDPTTSTVRQNNEHHSVLIFAAARDYGSALNAIYSEGDLVYLLVTTGPRRGSILAAATNEQIVHSPGIRLPLNAATAAMAPADRSLLATARSVVALLSIPLAAFGVAIMYRRQNDRRDESYLKSLRT